MKRLRNTSGIPDDTVKQIIDWIAGRLGISGFDVECRNCSGTFAGRAYTTGAREYHGNRRPFVVLRIGTENIHRWEYTVNGNRHIANQRSWLRSASQQNIVKISEKRFPTIIRPYQYAQHKGRRYVLVNRIEALVYLAAHELRHLWQAARWSDKRKSAPLPMYHGSRGKFSEVDTEGFAITMLREWKRSLIF